MNQKEPETKVPSDLRKALAVSPSAEALWKDVTPIARRDFITWIEGAKQPATRARRIEVTRSKLLSGDRRPCCYAVVPMNLYKALAGTPKAKAQWKELTPMERRDFVAWVEAADDKEKRGMRVEKVCLLLAAGKRRV
jgi:uncharacterized protein YdeI (YjbR/CyaY-like superfamily)